MAISPPDQEEAAQYLRDALPRMVPGAAVAQVEPLAEEVWQVALADGRLLVAKHQLWGFLAQGQPWDLLETETEVLRLLGRAGCPVPQVLGSDPQAQFILFSHCGSHTLEEAHQPAYLPQVIEGLLHIEEVLGGHQDLLRRRVMPQAQPDSLQAHWSRAATRARQGLEWLAGQCGAGPEALAPAREALDLLCAFLAARPPRLGTTDYNPRNLVVDLGQGQVRFIEFAKLGWDWTERRLVQYTNTVRPGFASLLDPDQVERWALRKGREAARALAGHHLVFCLNAAAMLGQALDHPGEHAAWGRAWAPLSPRLRQLVRCLRLSLSPDPWARAIRKVLG
ncbi:MAG: phosphotransferase [Candidatus Handelsmanbacteria bacterium]|nr:phosphotransferase [Candidatus Handelsmanbacteria bacterium]